MGAFGAFDWAVVAGYFLILLGLAWWVVRQRTESSAEYFLAGRHVGWFVIGASIFASNIGSEHIVGLAGTGAKSGIVMGHYELHSWLVLLLGWVFVPFYLRSQVFTMPEFLERRYGPAARWLLSLTALVGYVLTKRLIAELNKDALGGALLWFAEVNFLHFAILLFAVSMALLVLGSLLSAPPSPERIRGLTYATTVVEDRAASRASWNRTDVLLSAIVIVAILAILAYFSPLTGK